MTRLLSTLAAAFLLSFSINLHADEPDSAYVFAYGENGLRFAWSIDKENWHPIGSGYPFLKSDFGRWGSQKRMYNPVLFRSSGGRWHCLWTLNDDVNAFAYTSSENLTYWKPQSYPYIGAAGGNCRNLEVDYVDGNYIVSWENTKENGRGFYSASTKDFRHFTNAQPIAPGGRTSRRTTVLLDGNKVEGTIHQTTWAEIDHLIKTWQLAEYRNGLHGELMKDDPVRFAGLKPLKADITIHPSKSKSISDMLIGIFFEDINYAADGGLYAELVQNRGFEYAPSDRGHDKSWNSFKSWSLEGQHAAFTIDSVHPVHENNKHYAVLEVHQPGAALRNEGFGGIPLKKGEKYNFSLFADNLDGKSKKILIRLVDGRGKICGETSLRTGASGWKKYAAVITAAETAADARLEIIPQNQGKTALDMISLFPQKTFKGRRNGLRADLAQTLADMKPRFVRFPGGCVAHGDGIGNIYNWKNTIGPLEARRSQRNLWGYHQSMGLGYFEYFQFCEDIGAEPLPVIAAGVPCQNSGTGGHGQQCGIPMHEMGAYIQDILDLVEWANGDPKKSRWAKMRAEAGHPKPFNLKYIGIGNEDLISDVFEERFVMICNAIKEKYPEIMIIGTAGPFYEGSDYTEGWRVAAETKIPLIDEHYYVPPAWFIYNQDYYDRYDRSKPKVYLGEYAAHVPGRRNNIETALTEALHLANIERNGDIVSLTSYAPLLAKEGYTQWNPDLIYFNNTEVKPTTGYYVQQMYGQNLGNEYLPSLIKVSDRRNNVRSRVACSVVRSSTTGEVIIKLINLLPAAVKTKLNINDLNLTGTSVAKTVLSGRPGDEAPRPVKTEISTQDAGEIELAPYSFTVLRMK